MNDNQKSVLEFIWRFTNHGKLTDTVSTFTSGCCYWFAAILTIRFWNSRPVIMYDEISNHFGTKIHGAVYDVTGDVTEKYSWEAWDDVYARDELHGSRIVRDCIELRDFGGAV